MRTFVISDAHGYPELIRNALDHGGFRPGADRFVYAGDLLDRGPDPDSCIRLVDQWATEVLLGNHEIGVMLDFAVYPQTPESYACRQVLFDRVLGAGPESGWKAATCVDGVLVTHAGVSSEYGPVFWGECRGDPSLLAAWLNQELLTAIRHELETGEWDEDGILGHDGPTWFRPTRRGFLQPLPGLRQVVGHTPPVEELEHMDFYMVDPCVFMGMDDPGRFRYAVIEEGQVRVEEGALMSVEVQTGGLVEAPCR